MATEDHDAGVVGSSAGSDESSVHAAPALLPIIWADPEHLPEHLAIFSVRHFGHRAASGVQKLREQNPRPAAPLRCTPVILSRTPGTGWDSSSKARPASGRRGAPRPA